MQSVSYPFLEKLVAAAKKNYPKLKTYEARVNIAKANIQKAEFDWFNIFSFSYLRSPDNTTTLVNPSFLNGYQYGVTANVGALLQKPSAVRVAKQELEIARLNQSEYDLNIEAIVQQRYFYYLGQLTMLNWKTKSMENAERSVKDLEHKFEKGEETFEAYNKSVAYYTVVVQEKIKSEAEFLVAKSSLEEIIGVKLETIK